MKWQNLALAMVLFATPVMALDSTTATGYDSLTGTVVDSNTNVTSNNTNTNVNTNNDTINSTSVINSTTNNTNTNLNTNNTTYTGTNTNTNTNLNTNNTTYTGTNTNTNVNTNTNTTTSNNTNTNNNTNNTTVNSTSNNTNTNNNNNTSTSTSNNTNTNTNTNNNNNYSKSDSNVNYTGMPVNSAVAPNVTVNQDDLCVSGVAGAAQTVMFGISGATTIRDENCERIKLARELRNGGMKVASIAMMCDDPRVFRAMMMSGTPCPFKGLIGKEAAAMWNKYPELRPDYEEYLKDKKTLVDAGYMTPDGKLIENLPEEEKSVARNEQLPLCGPSRNWNMDQCRKR